MIVAIAIVACSPPDTSKAKEKASAKLEHTKLTYHYQGRDFRLTDVFGEPIKELIS